MASNDATAAKARQSQKHREIVAAYDAAVSQAGRDIGPTPSIASIPRRRRCKSLATFCRTYNPAAFYWPWSDDHLRVIDAIERSVQEGLILAFAMPRGSGKTALCRMGVLWAVSWGLSHYAYLIGANEPMALRNLEAVKGWMRALHPYIDDFPEVSHAIVKLGKVAQRAAGQHQGGLSTDIVWETHRIVLPRVHEPPNMPKAWRSGDGFAKTSQAVVAVSGLTGEGIRGSLFADPVTGALRRPDLILLDDPQTDESAKSLQQNNDREELIAGAVLGMANPDRPAAVVMPCTVIRRGDMVDRILDRKRNPTWRGIRTKLFRSMPTNKAAWDLYEAEYTLALGQDVPDRARLNRYYRDHRAELDEGADVSWTQRKQWEVSAVQHGMHLYFRKRSTFHAEYQNEPIEERSPKAVLTANLVANKLSGLDRGVVPQACQWVTAYCDVHERVLYWVVAAWEPHFAGAVIDYGTYPKQPTAYFAQQSAPVAMAHVHRGVVEDAWLVAGMQAVADELLSRTFRREDGAGMRVGKLLYDARWGEKNKLVKAFCRRHKDYPTIVFPAQGIGIGASSKPFDEYRPEAGAQVGMNWRIGPAQDGDRWTTIDTNWWKSFAAGRLAMAKGTPGGWEIFGRDSREHELFADHCVAEEPVEVTAKGRTVDEWKMKPGRPDNHWWDCLCGAAVAGSMLGASVPERKVAKPERGKHWFSREVRV